MFSRKIILFLAFVTISLSYAQKRKKVDTVYVYENITVYDTVYLIKPVKFRHNEVILPDMEIREKFFVRNIYKEEIDKQRAENRISRQKRPLFEYGIEGGMGLKNSTWAQELSSDRQQFGGHFGVWVSKTVFTPQLSVMLSASLYRWNSTLDLDSNKEDTYLNGFYFTKDSQPLLFQRFNNKHFEYALQIKLLYEWKNFRPFAGLAVNRNRYTLQFLTPENMMLNKPEDFKSHRANLGFSLGTQYRLYRRILLSLEYQQHTLKNLSLKNSSFDFDVFKTNNTFAERKISFGISYMISRP
ncbi:outer membrane beta-barrel protein [Chryseobacterium sp. JJR-5R]|uniref:outer membrane beta-barrel protein n=1 Tax=Chryseobacterium sp. JJR-5R TaxID=3093923 RepID=UPI002A74EF4E|nr:outer membrane beta-barrel protein [Chryseobacterium sp. JJR-5R]WPO81778.1 outer membrane beta-barrel protein [Chryseobacterium sp. JJR-5R]